MFRGRAPSAEVAACAVAHGGEPGHAAQLRPAVARRDMPQRNERIERAFVETDDAEHLRIPITRVDVEQSRAGCHRQADAAFTGQLLQNQLAEGHPAFDTLEYVG